MHVPPDRQLPIADEIFLDHIAHFVSQATAARDGLVSAGFAPTPVSIQVSPEAGTMRLTGTGNITAMLRRGYVEVLFKTADTALVREFEAALAKFPGVHLAAFAVADADSAHRRLAESGFRVRPLFHMQRCVDTETGPGTAAFSIARVEPGEMAEGRIQMLAHHTEANVWQQRWLDHPNGSIGLADLAIVVADVEETAERFARFANRPARLSPLGRTLQLDRGRVELVTADALATMLPEIAIPRLPFMAAYGLIVRSLAQAESVLQRGGLHPRRIGGALALPFPAPLGHGVWLFAETAAEFPWSR